MRETRKLLVISSEMDVESGKLKSSPIWTGLISGVMSPFISTCMRTCFDRFACEG